MLRFLVRRVALGVLTLFAVSVLTFLMFFALPRDPAAAMCPKNCDAQRLERVRDELGLNDPKAVQYLRYFGGVFAGRDGCPAPCLGYSYVNNEPVRDTFDLADAERIAVPIGEVQNLAQKFDHAFLVAALE